MSDENCRRSTDRSMEHQVEELNIKVARLDERLMAADHALDLAREALTRWQASSNEWRQENVDQRSQYMTIDKGLSMIGTETALRYALERRVSDAEKAIAELSGKGEGSKATVAIIVSVLTALIGLTAFILSFMSK